jgi:WD40 repeat protein
MNRTTITSLAIGFAVVTAAAPASSQTSDILWAQRGTGPHHEQHDIRKLEYSGDGRTLLESISDGFRRWEVATGALLNVIPRSRGVMPMYGQSYSPDGRHIIGRAGNGWWLLFDASSGAPIDSVADGSQTTSSFSIDGSRLLIGGGNAATLYAFPSLNPVRNIVATGAVYGAISPDGRSLLRSIGGVLMLNEIATGEEIRQYAGAVGIVTFGFVEGGDRVVGYNGRDLVLWSTATAERLDLFRDRRDPIYGIMVHRNGGRRAITISTQRATGDSTFRVWDLVERRRTHDYAMSSLSYPLHAAALSPDERELAVLEEGGTIAFIEVETGAILRRIGFGIPSAAIAIASSADGRLVATAGADQTVRLFDGATGEPIGAYGLLDPAITGIDVSSDGRRVAFSTQGSGSSNYVMVFRTDTAAPGIKTYFAGPASVDIAPDDERYAVAASDGSVRVVRLDSDDEVMRLEGHGGAVVSVAYSPGGELLASVGVDMAIVIWDARTGELRRSLQGAHTKPITDVVFARDGQSVISVGHDGRAVQWWLDGSNRTLYHAAGPLYSVGISRDGMTAILGGASLYGVDVVRGGLRSSPRDPLRLGNGWYAVDAEPTSNRVATASGDGDVVMWRSQAVLDVPREPDARAIPFEIYPLPAAGHLTLRYSLDRHASVGVTVTDATGRRVLSSASERDGGEQHHTLDVGELAAGVYMISLRVGATVSSSRFVISD